VLGIAGGDFATGYGEVDLDTEAVAFSVMVVRLFDDDRAALDAPVVVLEAGGPAFDRSLDRSARCHVSKRDVQRSLHAKGSLQPSRQARSMHRRCWTSTGCSSRRRCGPATLLDPLRRRDWGDEVAYFADPDGNVVALARPLS
jgi:hypothetical protein